MRDPDDDIFLNPPAVVDLTTIWAGLVRLNVRVNEVADAVGQQPDTKGNGGLGLLGQVAALEVRMGWYDRMRERSKAMAFTASVAVAIVWWLTKDKWAQFFGVGQ